MAQVKRYWKYVLVALMLATKTTDILDHKHESDSVEDPPQQSPIVHIMPFGTMSDFGGSVSASPSPEAV